MKHFEEEYRKYVHENTPDLWNRIEAGLTEKTTGQEQTASHKVPDNWQVIESRLEEKAADPSVAHTQKRKPRYYLRGILTAAAGFVVIATAAITLNMRQKSAEEAKNASAISSAEETAYEREAEQSAETANSAPVQSIKAPESAAPAAEYDMAEEAAAEYDMAEETDTGYGLQFAPAQTPKEIQAEPEAVMSTIAPVPVKELGIALSIPPTMTARPLTTEEEEQGYICEYAGTAADGITPAKLTIRYIETEAETLDEYAAILAEEGITADREYASYIRTDVLEYTRETQKTHCILYFAENGTPVELSITPESTDLLRSISGYSAD